MACNESRDNLKLGGTADLIRPKHDRSIMLGTFFRECTEKIPRIACLYLLSKWKKERKEKDEAEKFSWAEV